MNRDAPGFQDVHDELLERIVSGFYPVGTRLPSCRALARELGSNPSTVDRAIARLAAAGRVRTYPRRGTVVVDPGAPTPDAAAVARSRVEQALLWARRLGLGSDELRTIVEDLLVAIDQVPRVALVECNERDLRNVQRVVQHEVGIEVQPVLLDEHAEHRLDEHFDAVLSPRFHLDDVVQFVDDPGEVLQLQLTVSPASLRQLIDARGAERLVVVAPTERGVEWMTALVGQCYGGPVDAVHLGVDDLGMCRDAPVVVTNNASDIPADALEQVGRVINVEWVLDPRSLGSLRSQVRRRVEQNRRHRSPARRSGRGASCT